MFGDTSQPQAVTLLGISSGIELAGLFAAEAGASAIVSSIYTLDSDAFVRVGVTPLLADHRGAKGTGWVTKCYLAGGFRRFTRSTSPDGHDGSETTRGLTATAGIELSDFSSRRMATTYRFLLGLTLPVSQTPTGYWSDPTYGGSEIHSALDASFQIGWGI